MTTMTKEEATAWMTSLNDEDIDYSALDEDSLVQLALDDEPYVATSAITELSDRKSLKVPFIASTIMTSPSSDRYLCATALMAWDRADDVGMRAFVRPRLKQLDVYVLVSLMEVILSKRDEEITDYKDIILLLIEKIKYLHDRESTLQEIDTVQLFYARFTGLA